MLPAESKVCCRPKMKEPNLSDLSPTQAVWKACPAELPSTPTFWVARDRPLFTANDFRESAISPDWGLKKVSTWNTADQSLTRGSVP
jgi:hypothetical protein